MPRLIQALPRYRRHRASGQAVVTIGGKDFYLGRHGTKASRIQYDKLVSEWLVNHRRLPHDEAAPTINEIMAAYLKFCQRHYAKNGKPTSEQASIKCALRYVRSHYGKDNAEDFGPVALKAVRQKMIDAGLSRGVINQNIGRIRRMFRWAASEQLVPVSIYQSLSTVNGILRGRSEARETSPIEPIDEGTIDERKGDAKESTASAPPGENSGFSQIENELGRAGEMLERVAQGSKWLMSKSAANSPADARLMQGYFHIVSSLRDVQLANTAIMSVTAPNADLREKSENVYQQLRSVDEPLEKLSFQTDDVRSRAEGKIGFTIVATYRNYERGVTKAEERLESYKVSAEYAISIGSTAPELRVIQHHLKTLEREAVDAKQKLRDFFEEHQDVLTAQGVIYPEKPRVPNTIADDYRKYRQTLEDWRCVYETAKTTEKRAAATGASELALSMAENTRKNALRKVEIAHEELSDFVKEHKAELVKQGLIAIQDGGN